MALTGGIGAGKSEALAAFARHGAATSSSDAIVHRLLAEDPEVKAALVARLGEGVLGEDGRPDRGRIAERVFADPAELAFLEGLLHPRVAREYRAWREQLDRLPSPPRAAVAEIPLLYETGGETRFDAVVVITAPKELRRARTSVREDGRERRLVPDEEKVRRADFSYVNDGTLEELDRFVLGVLERLGAAG